MAQNNLQADAAGFLIGQNLSDRTLSHIALGGIGEKGGW
jgi:hypothetical protein